MKNLMITLLACSMLSGCFYQTASLNDIKDAERICTKHNSEIDNIIVFFEGREKVVCTNRNEYMIQSDNLK